ncbi:hypothetical protein [Haloechinothrix salitolerans]|uniref:Uncharacterized protein n=1 Tax=Haloechinothrix salitolerans TaxID=926830 RepID=A0ABW2CAJ9_9PSEU
MRISEGLTSLGRTIGILLSAATIAMLAACDAGEFERDVRDSIDVETIETKLRALTSDPCHSDPASRAPSQCEKYVTQLANAANTIEAAANTGFPRLAEPGQRMTAAIADYRDANCMRQDTAGKGECVTALEDLADAVTAAKQALGA